MAFLFFLFFIYLFEYPHFSLLAISNIPSEKWRVPFFDIRHLSSSPTGDRANASNNITFLNNSVSCPCLKVFMLLSKVSRGKTSHAYFFLIHEMLFNFLFSRNPPPTSPSFLYICFIPIFAHRFPISSSFFRFFFLFWPGDKDKMLNKNICIR